MKIRLFVNGGMSTSPNKVMENNQRKQKERKTPTCNAYVRFIPTFFVKAYGYCGTLFISHIIKNNITTT